MCGHGCLWPLPSVIPTATSWNFLLQFVEFQGWSHDGRWQPWWPFFPCILQSSFTFFLLPCCIVLGPLACIVPSPKESAILSISTILNLIFANFWINVIFIQNNQKSNKNPAHYNLLQIKVR